MILASAANQWNISRVQVPTSMGDSDVPGAYLCHSGAILQNILSLYEYCICMNILQNIHSLYEYWKDFRRKPSWRSAHDEPDLVRKPLALGQRNGSMCSIHGVLDFSIQLLSETYENIWGMLWIKAVKAISLYSDTLGPRHLFLETPLWLWQRGFLGPEMARVHLWWVGLASVPTGIILAHGYI